MTAGFAAGARPDDDEAGDRADVEIALIWAQARGGVIGAGGTLPWSLPEDLARFRRLTRGCRVVMGRRTWDSLPLAFRPLPGRENVVLTRQPGWEAPGAVVLDRLEDALASGPDGTDPAPGARPSTVWVIGGGDLYAQLVDVADRLEITEVDLAVDGDTHAPPIGSGWERVEGPWETSTTGLRYRFVSCRRGSVVGGSPERPTRYDLP